MDIVSFAVGFALGRRSGGGGILYDTVYHDILDNIMELTTVTLSSHHTWKIGMWSKFVNTPLGTMTYGDLTGYYTSGMNYMFDNTDSQGEHMVMPVMTWYFNLVGIVYKGGSPVWATVIAPSSSYNDQVSTVAGGNGLYFQTKEYRLESVHYTSDSITPGFPSFSGNINGYYLYSYHSYSYDSTAAEIIDNGRITDDHGIPYTSSLYPFPHDNGVFSDLGFEELKQEYQYLAEEMYKYQGYTVKPLVVLN